MKSKKKAKRKAQSTSLKEFLTDFVTPNSGKSKLKQVEYHSDFADVSECGAADCEIVSTTSVGLSECNLLDDSMEAAKEDALEVFDKSPEQAAAAHKLFDEVPEQAAAHKIPQQPAQKKWTALFSENRSCNRGLQLDFVELVDDEVVLEKEDSTPLHNNWKHCLVGCFTGRFPGMQAVNNLTQGWGVKCTIIPYARGWIIFKFDCEADRVGVLTNGPYLVFGRRLILKNLSEKFKYDKDEFLDVPLWVKFHGVPLEYWNKKALSKIASKLGNPLHTDQITFEQKRISYARVLVEVNLRKKPITVYPVKSPSGEVIYSQKIEYENFPNYCFFCKSFNHSFEQCKHIGPKGNQAATAKGVDCTIGQLEITSEIGSQGQPETVGCSLDQCFERDETLKATKREALGKPQLQAAKNCTDAVPVVAGFEASGQVKAKGKSKRKSAAKQTVKPNCGTAQPHQAVTTPGTCNAAIEAPMIQLFTEQSNYNKGQGTAALSSQPESSDLKAGCNFTGEDLFDEANRRYDLRLMGLAGFKELISRCELRAHQQMEEDRDAYTMDERLPSIRHLKQTTTEAIQIYERHFGS